MNDGESKRDAEAEHSKDYMEMELDSDLVLPHPNDEWEAQDAASVLVIERSLGGATGIVALMERHPARTKVQASCCHALAMQLNRVLIWRIRRTSGGSCMLFEPVVCKRSSTPLISRG
jgi:hypothetical protein